MQPRPHPHTTGFSLVLAWRAALGQCQCPEPQFPSWKNGHSNHCDLSHPPPFTWFGPGWGPGTSAAVITVIVGEPGGLGGTVGA